MMVWKEKVGPPPHPGTDKTQNLNISIDVMKVTPSIDDDVKGLL